MCLSKSITGREGGGRREKGERYTGGRGKEKGEGGGVRDDGVRFRGHRGREVRKGGFNGM